jgi:hypothetical protein
MVLSSRLQNNFSSHCSIDGIIKDNLDLFTFEGYRILFFIRYDKNEEFSLSERYKSESSKTKEKQ